MMCSGTYQILHDFSGPVTTFLAAVAAVCVTWRLGKGQLQIGKQQSTAARQQAELAAVRLRHDLFDRRFELFEAARTFLIQDVYPQMNPTSDAIFIFARKTATAAFLVDPPLREYLEELRTSAFKLQKLSALVALQQWSDHAVKVKEKYQLVEWFGAQHEVLVAKFQPFLNLDYTAPLKSDFS
jgi:hypothetical protein